MNQSVYVYVCLCVCVLDVGEPVKHNKNEIRNNIGKKAN